MGILSGVPLLRPYLLHVREQTLGKLLDLSEPQFPSVKAGLLSES